MALHAEDIMKLTSLTKEQMDEMESGILMADRIKIAEQIAERAPALLNLRIKIKDGLVYIYSPDRAALGWLIVDSNGNIRPPILTSKLTLYEYAMNLPNN